MKNKIGRDKWKHFWVAIPIGIVLQVICFYFITQPIWSVSAAMVLLIIICYGFELFSLITKLGHHDFMDAIAGILGGAMGIAVVVLLKEMNISYQAIAG